jgi:hypothetical protein
LPAGEEVAPYFGGEPMTSLFMPGNVGTAISAGEVHPRVTLWIDFALAPR